MTSKYFSLSLLAAASQRNDATTPRTIPGHTSRSGSQRFSASRTASATKSQRKTEIPTTTEIW